MAQKPLKITPVKPLGSQSFFHESFVRIGAEDLRGQPGDRRAADLDVQVLHFLNQEQLMVGILIGIEAPALGLGFPRPLAIADGFRRVALMT